MNVFLVVACFCAVSVLGVLTYEKPRKIHAVALSELDANDDMKQLLLIDQEYGAGASTIGEKIAKRLGWNFFDQVLTDEIARLAKIPVGVCGGAWNAMIPFCSDWSTSSGAGVLTGTCRRPTWPF
jgi:hypothetical protein